MSSEAAALRYREEKRGQWLEKGRQAVGRDGGWVAETDCVIRRRVGSGGKEVKKKEVSHEIQYSSSKITFLNFYYPNDDIILIICISIH